jgi:hypothetical protein
VTHEYTLLVGGTVMAGAGMEHATAIAWAADTILAIGTDEEVRAISRGDSHVVDLQGAWVVPLAPGAAVLEVGGRADLAVFPHDPRPGTGDPVDSHAFPPLAAVLDGRVVAGALPGLHDHDHDDRTGQETTAPA